jgi:hypothetical protein
MLHEQQQTVLVRSNFRERTHVLLVNTPCSLLYNLCAVDVSSGLAAHYLDSVVTEKDERVYYIGMDLLLWLEESITLG